MKKYLTLMLLWFAVISVSCQNGHVAAVRHAAGTGDGTYYEMVMPVDELTSQRTPYPGVGSMPVDTVWCGSYYFYNNNYKPKNDQERELFVSRSTGSGCHPGVDISVPIGTPVRAVGDGTIIFAQWRLGWGNLIVIEHEVPDEGIVYSCYAHLSKIAKVCGKVVKGQRIGYTGDSGAPYPHLHFQIDKNPFPYYPENKKGFCYSSPYHPVNRVEQQKLVENNTYDPLLFVECHSMKKQSAQLENR
ncbi:MAG: M23 family metallopeptidase [Vulcanimicrobiota bacterium]